MFSTNRIKYYDWADAKHGHGSVYYSLRLVADFVDQLKHPHLHQGVQSHLESCLPNITEAAKDSDCHSTSQARRRRRDSNAEGAK